MKLFSRWFIIWGASFMFFCSYAVADVTIDIDGDMSEWTTSNGLTETVTEKRTGGESSESYLNPDATTRGNVHSEAGYSSGDYYDIETLGILIDSGTLYLGLDTNFDFTNESNNEDISTGDFIFTFYSYDENGGETTTDLALDFSFDTYTENGTTTDYLSSLTFYWAGVEFSTASDFQQDLAYGVTDGNDSNEEAYTFSPEDWGLGIDKEDDEKVWVQTWWGWYWHYEEGETDYTLELAINLDDLSATLQDIFASSDYVEMHWQMSCGNDILYVADDYSYSAAHAPEPATFFLLSVGILGASFLERRRQELQKKS